MPMPPGIITQPSSLPNGKVYAFRHRDLGKLGRLIITDAGAGRTQVSAEVEPGDINDPRYLQRLEILSQVIETYLTVLPGEHPPLPTLEEAKARVSVYQRFLAVEDSAEMEVFASRLTEDEQGLLLDVIAHSVRSALQEQAIDDAYGIMQREQDLRRVLHHP